MKREIDKVARKRGGSLSIIYFFDGGKTYTLKFPLLLVRIFAIASVFLLAWATIGSLFFVKNLVSMHRLSARLQTSLDAVFACQVKENSVYEKVYAVQNQPKKPTTLEPASHAAQSTPLIESKVEPVAHSKSINLLEAKTLHVQSDNADTAVTVETPFLSKKENHIDLSVALRNRKNSFRAQGLIWATAEWQDTDGKKHIVNSPEELPGKDKTDQPNANTFSIRQYKIKKFSFQVPNNVSHLSKIEIWLTDRESHKSRFELVGDLAI